MRSPIEILVDEACGVDSTVEWITFRCPECQRTKRVIRHDDDPPGELVANCPDCVEEQ
jgi:hypothetical protein